MGELTLWDASNGTRIVTLGRCDVWVIDLQWRHGTGVMVGTALGWQC